MTRYLVLNDPHLAVTAPSSRRTDDYMEACFDKLQQIEQLVIDHDLDFVACTGDWFHKKAPTATSHALTRRLLEWSHRVTEHCPILTIVGNHDVQFNDTSSASVLRQPLGVLLTNPGVTLLDPAVEGHQAMYFSDVVVSGTPFTKPVLIDGVWTEPLEQFQMPAQAAAEAGDRWRVHLTHASVLRTAPVWSPYTLASAVLQATNADIVHTGHIHDDLGFERYEGKTWTNVGSMTRGALTESTIERQPSVLLVTAVKKEAPTFEILPLACRPASEIYDVEAYREEKLQTREFAAWTDRLQGELSETSIEEKSLQDIVRESSLGHPERELALQLLNDAGA